MAKSKRPTRAARRRIKAKAEEERFSYDKGDVFYTSSTGVTVKCLPAAQAMDDAQSSVDMPKQADYVDPKIITDVGGSELRKPWTEEHVLGNPDEGISPAPEEIQTQWAAFQEAEAAAQAILVERMSRTLAIYGVEILDEEPMEEWFRKRAFVLGDESVPEGDLERLLMYVTKAVLITVRDGQLCSMGIYRASGADRELLDRIEAGFRSPVEGAEGTDAVGDTQAAGSDSEEGA